MAYEPPELIQPGNGKFIILSATDKDPRDKSKPLISKTSGSHMIKLWVSITDDSGNNTKCDEYIVPNTMWRLKAILDAAGRGELYSTWNEIKLSELIGLSGKCVIKNESFNNVTRSKIDKYIKMKAGEKAAVDVSHLIEDSDLPF